MYMRLMDEAEDFRLLGINPKKIEDWENARRSPVAPGAWEAWNVEAWDERGMRVTVSFFTRQPSRVDSGEDTPHVRVTVTLPAEDSGSEEDEGGEARCLSATADIAPSDCVYGTEDGIVRMGESGMTGTYAACDVHAEPAEETSIDSANLHLESVCRPLRPGTGVFDLGKDGKVSVGWLSAMPCATVSGSVTIDGEEHDITGWARQTHLWGTLPPCEAVHHVLYATQRFDDGVLTILDITAARRAGYIRYPMAFLTNKRGATVLASTVDKRCVCTTEGDEAFGVNDLTRPQNVTYVFTEPGDVTLTAAFRDIVPAGEAASAVFGSRRFGAKKRVMACASFTAQGALKLREPKGAHMTLVPDVSDRKGESDRLALQGGAGSLDDVVDMSSSERSGMAAVVLASASGTYVVEHSEQVTTEYVL